MTELDFYDEHAAATASWETTVKANLKEAETKLDECLPLLSAVTLHTNSRAERDEFPEMVAQLNQEIADWRAELAEIGQRAH